MAAAAGRGCHAAARVVIVALVSVRIVKNVFSSSGRRSPAKRAAAAPPPPSSPLQRPGQAGDENTPPPLRIAPQAPAGNKGATRERVFFVTA